MNTVRKWASQLRATTRKQREFLTRVWLCPRAMYGGLAASHIYGCIEYPMIYGPTTLIYAIMAIRRGH